MQKELETPFIISQVKDEDLFRNRSSSYSPHYQQGQPPLKVKKKMSTKVRRILMQIFDIFGVAGFLVYCGLMQTYISTFYSVMFLLIINFTLQSFPKGIGMY